MIFISIDFLFFVCHKLCREEAYEILMAKTYASIGILLCIKLYAVGWKVFLNEIVLCDIISHFVAASFVFNFCCVDATKMLRQKDATVLDAQFNFFIVNGNRSSLVHAPIVSYLGNFHVFRFVSFFFLRSLRTLMHIG